MCTDLTLRLSSEQLKFLAAHIETAQLPRSSDATKGYTFVSNKFQATVNAGGCLQLLWQPNCTS